MLAPTLRAFLSHWKRHPDQALALFVGLALATALWTGVQAINSEARAAYDRSAQALAQSDLPLLVARDADRLPLSSYVALRRAGWAVAPVVEGLYRHDGARYRLIGLDPLTAPALPLPNDGLAKDPAHALLTFTQVPGELRAAPETIKALAGADLPPLRPASDLTPGLLVGDIGIVSGLLGHSDTVSHLLLLASPRPHLPQLTEIAPELRQIPASARTDITGLTASFHLNLTAFGFLSFVVGLFIVHATIGLAFEQRRAMMTSLRALGVPLRQLITAALLELLSFSLLAGLSGLVLGYVIAAALLPDVASSLRGLYGAPLGNSLNLRGDWIIAGLAMAGIGTVIAGAENLWAIAKLPVLAPRHSQGWALSTQRRIRFQAIAAALLLLTSGGLVWLGDGLVASFALLGTLLLGAALALPAVLNKALDLASRGAKHPVAQWFWADSRQQLPGLSMALMALLLALAANIGVSTMVASFRTTFEGWLDQRLAAEIYLNFGDDLAAAQALPYLTETAEAVLPITQIEAQLGSAPGAVYGMADHATYRQDWPLLAARSQVWDELHQNGAVLINEQWANQADLSLGDTVRIDQRSHSISGIYADYGNPKRQAIMGLDQFRRLYPQAVNQRFALRVPPDQTQSYVTKIQEVLALRSDQITNQEAIKTASRQVFERTFAVTGALNILTLGVAAFSIFTSLLTLQTMRLPQLAPVWALGLPLWQLGALDLLRAGILAGFAALLALPTGIALAWALIAVVNVEAFGWRLPLQLFPRDWAWLMLAALLAALCAAALPAWRLSRKAPAELTKVFALAR
ncbi:MAG: FtsX-like permease family protein [Mangrovicoccus sp.]